MRNNTNIFAIVVFIRNSITFHQLPHIQIVKSLLTFFVRIPFVNIDIGNRQIGRIVNEACRLNLVIELEQIHRSSSETSIVYPHISIGNI